MASELVPWSLEISQPHPLSPSVLLVPFSSSSFSHLNAATEFLFFSHPILAPFSYFFLADFRAVFGLWPYFCCLCILPSHSRRVGRKLYIFPTLLGVGGTGFGLVCGQHLPDPLLLTLPLW